MRCLEKWYEDLIQGDRKTEKDGLRRLEDGFGIDDLMKRKNYAEQLAQNLVPQQPEIIEEDEFGELLANNRR